MDKTRLEAFSDGVIAILITVLLLELKFPKGEDLAALRSVVPEFLAYALSFVYLGIYWNNHHHMLHATTRVNGKILWANLHLLFWLSLVPFVTGWMEDNLSSPIPTAFYGGVLFMSAISYWLLQNEIIDEEGPRSKLAVAVGNDWKGRASQVIYVAAIAAAFAATWISQALYAAVALMWFVPDRRIEKRTAGKE